MGSVVGREGLVGKENSKKNKRMEIEEWMKGHARTQHDENGRKKLIRARGK